MPKSDIRLFKLTRHLQVLKQSACIKDVTPKMDFSKKKKILLVVPDPLAVIAAYAFRYSFM